MAAAMTEQQIPKLTFTVCDDGDENLHLSTSDDDSTGSNNNIEDGEVEVSSGNIFWSGQICYIKISPISLIPWGEYFYKSIFLCFGNFNTLINRN